VNRGHSGGKKHKKGVNPLVGKKATETGKMEIKNHPGGKKRTGPALRPKTPKAKTPL